MKTMNFQRPSDPQKQNYKNAEIVTSSKFAYLIIICLYAHEYKVHCSGLCRLPQPPFCCLWSVAQHGKVVLGVLLFYNLACSYSLLEISTESLHLLSFTIFKTPFLCKFLCSEFQRFFHKFSCTLGRGLLAPLNFSGLLQIR